MALEDEDDPPVLRADMTIDEFSAWVDIDAEILVSIALTVEEEEAQLMRDIKDKDADLDSESEEGEGDDDKVEVEEEPTPSNAEIRHLQHRLRVGLEMKGFDRMDAFETFLREVRDLLCRQPMIQTTFDSVIRK